MYCSDQELSALKQQVNLLEESIEKEEEKAYDLEMKSKYLIKSNWIHHFLTCI